MAAPAFFAYFQEFNHLLSRPERRMPKLSVGVDGMLFEAFRVMELEAAFSRLSSIASEYLLLPFSPGPHDPSALMIATIAYPLLLSLLLSSAAANVGASILGAILWTLERVCLLFLIILASPAWVLSHIFHRSPLAHDFGGSRYSAKRNDTRQEQEVSWERASDFVSDLHPAFDILGVQPDASHSEIRSAYRRLMKLHHPDKFMGASPTEQERARRRTVEIRAAYEEALSSHPYVH
jgi:hypothetical protein